MFEYELKRKWDKIDDVASKKMLRSGHTLSFGELVALLLLLGCILIWNRSLFTNWGFMIPFAILVVALILW